MADPPARVWVKFKAGSEEALSTARRVIRALETRGVKAYADPLLATLLEMRDKALREDELSDIDMVIVVGGDGTLLRLFHSVGEDLPPILGVNSDRIGFLFDYDWRFVEELIDKIVSGNYIVEHRSVGEATLEEGPSYRFINEVVIGSYKTFKMISLEVCIDNERLYSGRMDGVIISTTTGSTAYALSAGGPLVDPHLDVIVVVPIVPFSPLLKPVILAPQRRVLVRLFKDGILAFDGIETVQAPAESEIKVKLRPGGLRLVRVPGGHTLERKVKSRLLDLPPWSLE